MTCMLHAAVGEWDACGNRFYSKVELYQMAWSDVNLDNFRFVPGMTLVLAVVMQVLCACRMLCYL